MNYTFTPDFTVDMKEGSISAGNIPKEDTAHIKNISRTIKKNKFVKDMKKWAKKKRRIVWDDDLIISVEVPEYENG